MYEVQLDLESAYGVPISTLLPGAACTAVALDNLLQSPPAGPQAVMAARESFYCSLTGNRNRNCCAAETPAPNEARQPDAVVQSVQGSTALRHREVVRAWSESIAQLVAGQIRQPHRHALLPKVQQGSYDPDREAGDIAAAVGSTPHTVAAGSTR